MLTVRNLFRGEEEVPVVVVDKPTGKPSSLTSKVRFLLLLLLLVVAVNDNDGSTHETVVSFILIS
jgi:hypothetical protein